MTREGSIFAADLRHRLVPCGECDFEEDDVSEARQDQAQIVGLFTTYQQETTNRLTELFVKLEHIEESGRWQREFAERMDARQDVLERKLDRYNSMRERLDRVEDAERTRARDYVPREEFNGATSSIRGEIKRVYWVLSLGFGTIGGVLGFVAARVFGA